MGSNKKIEYYRGQQIGECFYLYDVESKHQRKAIFRCKCGQEFETYIHSVRAGDTKSCGCYQIKRTKEANTVHGMTKHPLFINWTMMKERCHSPKSVKWEYYGGRGIKVCDEWRYDFLAFYDYVSALPHYREPGRSIDRVDNNGNYELGNIRWATISEQLSNRRPYKHKKNRAA